MRGSQLLLLPNDPRATQTSNASLLYNSPDDAMSCQCEVATGRAC